MVKKRPRVISLVPSWTETLLAADVLVVGRSRFCIHPDEHIKDIPVVGGTKSIDLIKIQNLKPDFVILDRQENTVQTADELARHNIQMLVSDVVGFESLKVSLNLLATQLEAPSLKSIADRYALVVKRVDQKKFLSQLIQNSIPIPEIHSRHVDYVIWKNPFMVIGANTFIAENLKLIGIEPRHQQKYPEISEDELKKSFCLFSSEPFPFAKSFSELQQRGFQGVVVDGEKLSWFGIRNLNFLESSV